MKEQRLLSTLDMVSEKYILEAMPAERSATKSGFTRYAAMAACLGLILTMTLLSLPALQGGPGGVVPPPVLDPSPTASAGEEQSSGPVEPSDEQQSSAEPLQPPAKREFTILWNGVTVNETDSLGPDAARRYFDPALYGEETWGEAEIVDYFGWNLAPDYIPEELTGGGAPLRGVVIRNKETGELEWDQIGRGFWSGFNEDGSPVSDTEPTFIPTGFSIRASKLGIFDCGILPTDGEKQTNFSGVPVTIVHCSLPYGPFDPDSYAPNGLYHTPAGYYDVYRTSFEVDGVAYDITADRLELEEVIKVTASTISCLTKEEVIVGEPCGLPLREAAQ